MRINLDPVTGKIFPVFLFYTVPSIIGMIAMSCAVVVDGFFLGNYASIASLASVNLTIPVSGILFGLAFMFSIGGAVRCGKFLGSGNFKAANHSFSQTIVFISLISLVITTLGITFMDQLVILLTTNKLLAPVVDEYLSILMIFTVFQLGAVCLSYFVRVVKKPFLASAAMISGCFINVLLDWVFIVKLDMGHQGAALGTGFAAAITFLLLCAPFLAKRASLKFCWRKKDISELFKAACNGFPELIDECSFGIFIFIFNWIIMRKLGASGIAAFSIINYIFIAGLMFSYGISDSLYPVISQNLGALKHKRIKNFMTLSMVSVFLVGLAISALLVISPDRVSDFFVNSKESETIKLTNHFISKIWPIFILNGLNVVLASYLTAMHKCFDSTIIILAKNLLFPVIFLFIIHIIMRQDAILIALPLSELAVFIIAIVILNKNSPKYLIKNVLARGIATPQ